MSDNNANADGEFKLSFIKRRLYMFVGALLAVGLLFACDPDGGYIQSLTFGGTTIAWLILVLRGLFVITLAHISLSSFVNWNPLADILALVKTAVTTSTGAGLALIGLGIMLHGILGVFSVK